MKTFYKNFEIKYPIHATFKSTQYNQTVFFVQFNKNYGKYQKDSTKIPHRATWLIVRTFAERNVQSFHNKTSNPLTLKKVL